MVLLVLHLSGCAKFFANMERAEKERAERECLAGSQCFANLTPEQRYALIQSRREEAYRQEMLQIERDRLRLEQQRAQDERIRNLGAGQTHCRSDGLGGFYCQ